MAAENVIDWLSRSVVIDLVTRPVSHGMQLWEFIPDAGNSINLQYDLPIHLCWGTSEDRVREAIFDRFVDILPRVQGLTLPFIILAMMEWCMDTTHTFHLSFNEMMITPVDFAGDYRPSIRRTVLPMPTLFDFDATTNERTLPQGRAWRFSMRYAHTTSNISAFRQMLNGLAWDRDITLVLRGSPMIDHLEVFLSAANAIFVQTQLLVHVPPSAEFDPFTVEEELDRDQGDALARHGLLQWLINHFDHSNNLFPHNNFEICPLFEEYSIIFGRIPVTEEIPIVPWLNIDPALMSMVIFSFSAYEIPSYDFRANVVPLRPLIDHALGMDRTGLHSSTFASLASTYYSAALMVMAAFGWCP
ncbi:hypothetical protein JCGZ_25676 [Jatropha curcas]|uniref:Aminotransferase-like plant mobile domain-containing protein n=1 Tax=Jatropha curcas TaxID=180498 RepID=A0A067LFI4_JATCU|nr:hypothetical protein JCGZ_25676 [Jatropha curcas]